MAEFGNDSDKSRTDRKHGNSLIGVDSFAWLMFKKQLFWLNEPVATRRSLVWVLHVLLVNVFPTCRDFLCCNMRHISIKKMEITAKKYRQVFVGGSLVTISNTFPPLSFSSYPLCHIFSHISHELFIPFIFYLLLSPLLTPPVCTLAVPSVFSPFRRLFFWSQQGHILIQLLSIKNGLDFTFTVSVEGEQKRGNG